MKKLLACAVIGGLLAMGCTPTTTSKPKAITGGGTGTSKPPAEVKKEEPKVEEPKKEEPKKEEPKKDKKGG